MWPNMNKPTSVWLNWKQSSLRVRLSECLVPHGDIFVLFPIIPCVHSTTDIWHTMFALCFFFSLIFENEAFLLPISRIFLSTAQMADPGDCQRFTASWMNSKYEFYRFPETHFRSESILLNSVTFEHFHRFCLHSLWKHKPRPSRFHRDQIFDMCYSNSSSYWRCMIHIRH